MHPLDESPWYRDGLSFTCTRCGSCCTGEPGYVWVNAEQIHELTTFVGDSVEVFMRKYVRRVGTRLSLIEKPNNDCVFWDRERGCTVYAARPVQCRTWPFWSANVETPEDWERTCRVCPGSGQGNLVRVEDIESAVGMTERSRS